MTEAAITKLLSADSNNGVVAHPAGDHVVLFASHGLGNSPTPGTVAVLDHNGKVIGTGAFDAGVYGTDIAADPSGSQWAWSVDDLAASADTNVRHRGGIMVAGLGIPKHSVYSWVAPLGATDRVGAWTDLGIVMKRFTFGGCGPGFLPDTASFLIDPQSGTLTDLFSGQAYLDAQHQVRVARSAQSSSNVSVNGVSYDQQGTILNGAWVSPDGTRVGVARLQPLPCAQGPATALVSTELITVATGTRASLPGCEISGWFDATHFACSAFNSDTVVLHDLSGTAGATLGNGRFVGVLQAAQ